MLDLRLIHISFFAQSPRKLGKSNLPVLIMIESFKALLHIRLSGSGIDLRNQLRKHFVAEIRLFVFSVRTEDSIQIKFVHLNLGLNFVDYAGYLILPFLRVLFGSHLLPHFVGFETHSILSQILFELFDLDEACSGGVQLLE